MPAHPIVHIEFSASDRQAAGKFYAELFGWKVQQMPEMNYATIDTGQTGIGAGLNPVQENYPAGTVIVYIHSDDIDATLARVQELGGKILVPKSEIPGVGWFGMFADPSGNQVGLLKDISNQP